MATVQLKQIRKSYGDHEIIRGIDLTLNDQELTVFVGPSGCGKSTLLRLIAGLEDIDSGDLLIDNTRVNDIAPAKRGLALVFQSYALYPHMNVAENMSFSLKLAGIPKPEREAKVLEAARILNLEQYLDRKPKDLSGGQRQRVAIGRAIVRNPKVFLFDEPLSNLDAALRVRMRLELTALHRKLAATMIYVTHDQVEAMTMADRIVVLNAGRVEQVGTPMELYRTPRNLFVAGFIGSPKMNLLPAAILDDSTAHTIGIRPEHICLSNEGLPATVQLVEHLGSESYIHAQLATGEPITLRLNGETTLTPDQTIHLTFTPTHLHRFNTEGEALT